MAKVQIDLSEGFIKCAACGNGNASGTLSSPCFVCGVIFTEVEYKRVGKVKTKSGREKVKCVRKVTSAHGRTTFTLGDIELEKRIAVDYIWQREAAAIARKAVAEAQGKGLDLIQALDVAKRAFYLKHGISIDLEQENKIHYRVAEGKDRRALCKNKWTRLTSDPKQVECLECQIILGAAMTMADPKLGDDAKEPA